MHELVFLKRMVQEYVVKIQGTLFRYTANVESWKVDIFCRQQGQHSHLIFGVISFKQATWYSFNYQKDPKGQKLLEPTVQETANWVRD